MSQKLIKIREGFNVTPRNLHFNNTLYINNDENLNNVNGEPVVGNQLRCFNPNSSGFSWNDVFTFLEANEDCYTLHFVNSTYTGFNIDFHTLASRYFVIECDNSTFEDSTFSHAIFKNIYKIKGNSFCYNAQLESNLLEGILSIADETALGSEFPNILNIDSIRYCDIIIGANSNEYININIGVVKQYLDISGNSDFYQINRPISLTIGYLNGSLYIHDFQQAMLLFKINILYGDIFTGDPDRDFGIVLDDVSDGLNNIDITGNIKMSNGNFPLFTFNEVRSGLSYPILRLNNVVGSVVTNKLISLNSSTCSMNIINSTIATTQYLYTSVSSSFSIYTRNFLTNYTGSSYVGDPKIINTITQDAYLKI